MNINKIKNFVIIILVIAAVYQTGLLWLEDTASLLTIELSVAEGNKDITFFILFLDWKVKKNLRQKEMHCFCPVNL